MSKLLKHDYFDIFKTKPSFNIDKADLKLKYYDLSKKYHPDNTKTFTEITMEDINKAYSILSDDYSRAKYLTNFTGFDLCGDFLMKVFEFEEKISEAGDLNTLEDLKKEINWKIEECKMNYKSQKYLAKWSYYLRLLRMIEGRIENLNVDVC